VYSIIIIIIIIITSVVCMYFLNMYDIVVDDIIMLLN